MGIGTVSTTQRRADVLARAGLPDSQWFRFDRLDVDGDTARLCYVLDGVGTLTETVTFTGTDLAAADRPDVRAALELLHLTAGVSYLKATLPPAIEVAAWPLDAGRRALLHDLVTYGLAELGHHNGVDLWDWFHLPEPTTSPTRAAAYRAAVAGPLVPVGGGKDSAVTLEALRSLRPTLFGVNPKGPIERTFAMAGLPVVRARRRLDERLFDLNAAGAFNGHVPVTAIVSAISVVAATVGGHDVVAMSNERSADQPTLVHDGRAVNHQWSKSSAFEQAFARLVEDQVNPALRYVSFLRPASELAIARRFATLTAHHGVFNSCNRAFHLRGKTTEWCGQCPKCRFVYLGLAPFMAPADLVAIFGRDLLADPANVDGFAALAAIGGHKPFECVGEAEESAAALACLASRPAWREHAVVRSLADRVGEPGCERLDAWLAPGDPSGLPPSLREAFRVGV